MTRETVLNMMERLPCGYACANLLYNAKSEAEDGLISEANTAFIDILSPECKTRADARSLRVSECLMDFLPADPKSRDFYGTLTTQQSAQIDHARITGRDGLFHIDAFMIDADSFTMICREEEKKQAEDAGGSIRRDPEDAEADFIFNSTQDAMFIAEFLDGEFRYLRLNTAHRSLSGLQSTAVQGKTPIDVWGKETGSRLHQFYLDGVNSSGGITVEESLEMRGKIYRFMTSLTPARRDGRLFLIVSRKDITQYKELQTTNLALLRRFQAMFSDHIAVMLIIDPETGRILNANPAACRFYGYEMTELLEMSIQDINMLPAEETARLRRKAFEREEGHFIFPHRLKSGEIRFVEVYSCPYDSMDERKLFSIIFDVTDRETYKEELFREKDLLNTTLRSIGDGVITTDTDGNITSMNKAAECITLWSSEEAAGKPVDSVFRLVNELNGETVRGPVSAVLKTKDIVGIAGNTALLNKNDEQISIADSAAPIVSEQGGMLGVVVVFRDIRAEKARQSEVVFFSYHDALTGLPNRRFAERELHRIEESGQLPVSIVMGDVNGLKIANDVFSHETGDMLLKNVASVFQECTRSQDVVARWGGDEFLVVMTGASLQDAEKMVRKLNERFAQRSVEAMQLSVSLGCAEKAAPGQPIQHVVRQAEDAMYHQKLLEGRRYRDMVVSTLLETLYEKSMETEDHAERLAKYCRAIGDVLHLSDQAQSELALLSLLHDIGKVGISHVLLKKASGLTPEEWTEMKRHPEIGYRIAQNTRDTVDVSELILCHHERWDGTGYPAGIGGDKIPLNCRILAVVDAFDAMTTDRAYRKALSKKEAVTELRENAGTQFDSTIVEVFLIILQREDAAAKA
jgi:diguanylate cyclase (GGDEF)-like protein/PAS domain S-box-containing protein